MQSDSEPSISSVAVDVFISSRLSIIKAIEIREKTLFFFFLENFSYFFSCVRNNAGSEEFGEFRYLWIC